MTALLNVQGLAGGYGSAPILRDINLSVRHGEIVALLGANGAGKTSVLRALSGSLPASEGTILLGDKPIQGLTPWSRVKAGIAHVPEGRHVFPDMTVQENLDVAHLVRRGGDIGPDDVFDLFPRLRERQRQAAGSLSGGEQQMLVIGRGLVTGPQLLAVDEMSAGLAPALVDHLVDGLLQLRGRVPGILLVEQSPHFIARAVDRVYLIQQGRIADSGSLQELGGADRLADMYLGVH